MVKGHLDTDTHTQAHTHTRTHAHTHAYTHTLHITHLYLRNRTEATWEVSHTNEQQDVAMRRHTSVMHLQQHSSGLTEKRLKPKNYKLTHTQALWCMGSILGLMHPQMRWLYISHETVTNGQVYPCEQQ